MRLLQCSGGDQWYGMVALTEQKQKSLGLLVSAFQQSRQTMTKKEA
jgi:hypothetical protein